MLPEYLSLINNQFQYFMMPASRLAELEYVHARRYVQLYLLRQVQVALQHQAAVQVIQFEVKCSNT